MSGKRQVGLRVDAELYEQFKADVKDRRGRWQGVGGEELENALREYIIGPPTASAADAPDGIEQRLARIEEAVGIEATDGGTDTFNDGSHTHTPTPAPEERPDPQAATERKVRWLAECVLDEEVPNSRSIDSISTKALREVVKDEYGFRADTAKRYVDELIDHFDLVEHPTADGIYATEDYCQHIMERKREDAKDDVAQQTDELNDAEAGDDE